METFFTEYQKQLEICVQECPDQYHWGPGIPMVDQVPFVLERMKKAFAAGTYNKDGEAIKRTCKTLGIKHTYKAINHFIANHA